MLPLFSGRNGGGTGDSSGPKSKHSKGKNNTSGHSGIVKIYDKLKRKFASLSQTDFDHLIHQSVEEQVKEEGNLCWFHENTNRNLAEHKLQAAGNKTGQFLVRESVHAEDFVLSVVHNKTCKHYQIKQKGHGTFAIGTGTPCQGLEVLIGNYQENGGGLATALMSPCRGQPPPSYSRLAGCTNLLHTAIRNGNTDLASRIISSQYCPDVNSKDSEGSTALHEASNRGLLLVVERLLQKNAAVILTDRDGYTPLQIACIQDHSKIAEVLISRGHADPQDRNPETGRVALHEAARRGHLHTVKVLLAMNAPAWPRDKEHITPYEMAKKGDFNDCAKYIENHQSLPSNASRDDWCHEALDREGAYRLLQQCGLTDGLFLVRRSTRHVGSYVLAMTYDLHPYNYEIQTRGNNKAFFIDEGPLLPSLEHVIEYYCIRADGLRCRLKTAITKSQSTKVMTVQWRPDESSSVSYSGGSHLSVESGHQTHKSRSPARRRKEKDRAIHARPPSAQEPMSLDPTSIRLGYELGQGEYGSVLSGIWLSPNGNQVPVAIKTLHNEYMVTGKASFLQEAEVMVKLNHECIVQLIGICQGSTIMLVQELMPLGSLLDFLLDYPEQVKVETDLFLWAAQIAYGMNYLEKEGFVHRDLAARNILLASKSQVKVGDFGLSRAVEGNSNYYKASVGGRWPVKWYAPECVNYGHFSSASDVWSYGVTLWEMFSFGDQPYQNMVGAQVLAFIEKGGRLQCPEKCPEPVYRKMKECWAYKNTDRPTFKMLYRHFRQDYELPDKVMTAMGYGVTSSSL